VAGLTADTHPMAGRVRTRVLDAIEERGSITFAEFMELALYGPHGYYERPPIGTDGDFVTSPHVHPVFGEFLADAIREMWAAVGGRAPQLVEVGAGDGTLLRQVMAGLDRAEGTGITAIDRSSGARRSLATIGGVEVLDDIDRAVEMGVFTRGPGVVLAHELLDNLPFRRVRGTRAGPVEIRIGAAGGRLVEAESPLDEGLRIDLARTIDPDLSDLSEGREIVVPVGALEFMDTVAAATSFAASEADPPAPWFFLAIDYGTDRGAGGDTHGYRDHRIVEDLLDDPGSSDITAGIGFDVLGRAAAMAGMTWLPTVSQRQALVALGFETWLRSALERQTDLLNTGRGSKAVRTWSGRTRAAMLIDPAGLGRFRWFVAGTPGLPAPGWLERARAQP
jgi:SAM-dependent MidA family methyltransferase